MYKQILRIYWSELIFLIYCARFKGVIHAMYGLMYVLYCVFYDITWFTTSSTTAAATAPTLALAAA